MRKLVEYPTPSLQERDRRWAAVRKEMAASEPRLPRAVRLAGDVGFQHRQRPLPLPDRRQCRVQRAGVPASGEPTSFIYSPVFTDYWRGAQDWVADVRPQNAARFADSVADRLTELKLDRRQGRHRRPRRPARSGRLGAAQHVHAAAGAAAGRDDRQSRGHAGEDPHREERRGDRDPRQGRGARRPDARGLPRHRASRRQGMRGLRADDAGHAGERRRGADAVPVGRRQAPLSASVPRADHASAGEGRHDHLRDASEIRRLFHPRRADLLPRQAGTALSRHL